MDFRSLLLAVLLAGVAAHGQEPGAALAGDDLEQNLGWIRARERTATGTRPRVGVYADAGAWHLGARSLVEALEGEGVACAPLDRTRLSAEGLSGLEVLVVPGGWAPGVLEAAGEEGLRAVRGFVEAGGRYVGVCAGAYVAAREVRWEGAVIAYPLGVFAGVAQGPLADLAPWPRAAPVRVRWTAAARERGITAPEHEVLYFGGPRLVPDDPAAAQVLARYPDGSAAVLLARAGRGEVVLSGVHLERPARGGGPAPAWAGAVLRALVAP